MSELQGQILSLVSSNPNVDYRFLENTLEPPRDRVTILQAIDALTRKGMIQSKRQDPNFEKSKLTFSPSDKGVSYAILYQGVDIDKYFRYHADLDEFQKSFKGISDKSLVNEIFRAVCEFRLAHNMFDAKGETRPIQQQDFADLCYGITRSRIQKGQFQLKNLAADFRVVIKDKAQLEKLKSEIREHIKDLKQVLEELEK